MRKMNFVACFGVRLLRSQKNIMLFTPEAVFTLVLLTSKL